MPGLAEHIPSFYRGLTLTGQDLNGIHSILSFISRDTETIRKRGEDPCDDGEIPFSN